MDEQLGRIFRVLGEGRFEFGEHLQTEMSADGLTISDIIAPGAGALALIEDYPEDRRGHSCLLLGWIGDEPIHLVCTVRRDPLFLITCYRPDPRRWFPDWRTRRPRA